MSFFFSSSRVDGDHDERGMEFVESSHPFRPGIGQISILCVGHRPSPHDKGSFGLVFDFGEMNNSCTYRVGL